MLTYETLFASIEELVLHHSPSGVEEEIDRFLLARFKRLGLETWQDRAGNVIAKIAGQDSERIIAITGHKDEIGAIVKSIEYPIEDGEAPVLLSQDGYGIYDENLNEELRKVARQAKIPLQLAAISGFGSDASIAMKYGHVARAACLGFPTQNTHGYEIAHLGAIANCVTLLKNYCQIS
jgi:putative aminopeptidase FrvX